MIRELDTSHLNLRHNTQPGDPTKFRKETQSSCILNGFSAVNSHISTKITFAGRVHNHVCYLIST